MKLKTPITEVNTVALIFIVTIIVGFFASWIWAIHLLYKNWQDLPGVVQIIGILGVFQLIPLGHILTIILVMVYRKKQ